MGKSKNRMLSYVLGRHFQMCSAKQPQASVESTDRGSILADSMPSIL